MRTAYCIPSDSGNKIKINVHEHPLAPLSAEKYRRGHCFPFLTFLFSFFFSSHSSSFSYLNFSIYNQLPPALAKTEKKNMATIRTTLADLVNFSNMVPSPPPMPVYDKFLGLELTPANVLFLQTTVVSFFAQFVLFYTTWFFFPSFGKDRRRLAWVSSFYCSLFLSIAVMAELGMVRTTVFERLGMDTVTLGLPANATLFSYLLPKFNAWALQLGSNHVKGSRDGLSVILQQLQEWNAESVSVLAGTFLRWMVNQPIFSLAPLKPVDPAYIVEGAPYYFGGGGRLLFSMEGAHQSSRMGAVMVGYVAGYFLADNVLAALHFFAHHSYLSGWVHHIAYTGVAYSLAKHHTLSLFSICVGTFERKYRLSLSLSLIIYCVQKMDPLSPFFLSQFRRLGDLPLSRFPPIIAR